LISTACVIRWEAVEIRGSVRVPDLLTILRRIYIKAREILTSGIKRGGKFILTEANDLASLLP
jgi:hypothetical protein